jgi:hypothetical protein
MNWRKKKKVPVDCAFPKTVKKSAKRLWKNKCLEMWSKVVRLRAGNRCERCPASAKEAHHIIPRGTHPHMGWFDLNNGVSLCFNCHQTHGAHSLDFDEQVDFNKWVRSVCARRGVDYDVLKMKCKAPGSMTEFDLKIMYDILRKEKEKYV